MSELRFFWQLRGRTLEVRKPLVMGIVNVTPDSFSDGGSHATPAAAVAHALDLVRQGADLLDIGGESTRPGAAPVPLEEELARVIPVVRSLAQTCDVPLSIDTYKAEVARQALAVGAHIINDVTALLGDLAMGPVVRDAGAGVVLMHMQGTPQTMQRNPTYENVVEEVIVFLEARLQAAEVLGIAATQVVLDPGIGFGKTVEHNVQLLSNLAQFQRLGRPVLLGVSRKGVLGKILGRPLQERLAGSLAMVCHALAHGAVQVIRVHDVPATRDAVAVMEALSATSHEIAPGLPGGRIPSPGKPGAISSDPE